MKERPTSVTIIGWYLVVVSLLSLMTGMLTLNNPIAQQMMQSNALPVAFQYLFSATALFVLVINGFLLLKGNNVGRWLYIGWHLFSFALSMFNLSSKAVLIPGLIIFLLITFLLFRPNANAYFAKQPEEPMTHA
ncbi:hypothetical protein [Shewanella sp.]|uniref:hypothetical protein n=1 Tax=Shewanella sp. TaxID=50422 RepID=UPI003A96AD21